MIYSAKANGNVSPSRFVKGDTTGDRLVVQAGSGDKVVGVSQKGTRRTPYGSLDDGFAAVAGENLEVYGNNEECLVEAGGTITPYDRLKSDSNGKAVATTTNLDEIGGIALTAGISGQLVHMRVFCPVQVSS